MQFTCSFLALWIALFMTLAADAAPAQVPEAVPVDGEPFPGELAAIDAQWQVTFQSAGTTRVLPAADLVSWGKCPEAGRRPLVVLADGGLLAADAREMDKDNLTADSDLFGPVKLPLEVVAGIVFQPPADRHRRDLLLDRIASASGDADRLVLANDDEIVGRVQTIAKESIQVKTGVGALPVEIRRTRAILFNPALLHRPASKGLRAHAGFRDGSRLLATGLAVNEKSLKITTAGGIAWTTSPQELTWLAPLGGRVTYLSDLKPDEYRYVPFLELRWPYRNDRSVTGAWLRCGGRPYLKGLGVHSAARLTYLLGEPYRRFQAELGIDDETTGRGSVRFRVFVDGKPRYESPTVVGGQPPVPVSLDISGAKRLDLIVDYADRADEMDHADWLNARLVR